MRWIGFIFILPTLLSSQSPNCNVYLYNKDTAQYKACKMVESVPFYQYSRSYQERFDSALIICPYFAYAYSAKSTAYLKSGDFINWKFLIDKAVQFDSIYLDYRAWCRYQFFRDYKGAIQDIEILEKRSKSKEIGYSAGGEYHLLVAKAMCYSALNQKHKAIEILEDLLSDTNYLVGQYDYYQLAVSYFQINDYEKAWHYCVEQNKVYELAESKYYMAKISKLKGKQLEYSNLKAEAIRLYQKESYLFDPYTEHFNKVYYKTILNL
ncbi:MAG: hypothetical protein IPM48_01695 [Saprospiraceae bacterium]|nr:hypothetical protein [Saprospiraceae bacterium]